MSKIKVIGVDCNDGEFEFTIIFDVDTWTIKTTVQHTQGKMPNFSGLRCTDLALWLRVFKKVRIEAICETCYGEGVVETELYEGLVNCPCCLGSL